MKKLTSKEAKPAAPAKAVIAAAPVASKSTAAKPAVQSKAAAVQPKEVKPAKAKTPVTKPVAVVEPKEIKAKAPAKAKVPAKAPAVKVEAPAAKPVVAPAVKAVVVESLPSTVLIAQVDVGFGNTLAVRGEGGGLSWEKGLPMQNIGATQWQLTLPATTMPVVFKFLINDERWSIGDDYVAVPGSTSSLVPLF